MRKFLLIATLLFSASASFAGIFSWTDASGNIVYGDNPPDTAAAKSVAPPKLTILEGFANRYPDQNVSSGHAASTSSEKQARAKRSTSTHKRLGRMYSALTIIAPKMGQSIRANDGDVSIAVSMSPKLRSSDRLVIYLNGQEYAKVKSRVANLSNLDRGEYKVAVEIQNEAGESLKKSAETSFIVQRNSVITNKKKPYNPYTDDPSQ